MDINLEDVVGAVRIRVRRGTNLVRRDSKSSDPYVAVTMGTQKLRSRTEKNNCNPEWNDELTLAITSTDPDLPVKLTVYDEDTMTTDDAMGWAELDVKSLRECGRMELEGIENGTMVSKIHPSRQNCLAEDSNIVWKDGKLRQDMILRLNDVETGEVDIQLEWVDITGQLTNKA
ncbi:uncharacterized protein [Phyllobates terribilis]|uniref:uncharacterized protein n=1 Tax=Phyllobates terribilis TaxID=111132 RepID=UPI003CCA7DA6